MNRVDVIVPCYNYGRFLPDCVESVLSQEGVEVRVLIIDDASTDGSAEVARELASADRRVQLVLHETNRGHIATYNEGLGWADSDFMLLLSADDLAAPGAFARAVEVMGTRSSVGMVYGQVRKFTAPTELAAVEGRSADHWVTRVMAGRSFLATVCATPSNPVETATAIVRTRIQKAVGGYRPELPHAGDMEMWLRFAAVGDLAHIDAVQAFVRMHDDNMRYRYSAHHEIGDFQQRVACFRLFFREFDHRQADGPRLLTNVQRAIAHEMLWRAIRLLEVGNSNDAIRLAQAAAVACPWISLDMLWIKFQVRRLIGPMAWQVLASK